MPLISPDHEIERVEAPSMQAFYRDYMKSQTPVIVTHAMDYWPALTTRKWYVVRLLNLNEGETQQYPIYGRKC